MIIPTPISSQMATGLEERCDSSFAIADAKLVVMDGQKYGLLNNIYEIAIHAETFLPGIVSGSRL
jgi:hypothetical protein